MADGDEPIEPINVYNDLPAALQAHVLRQASDDSVLQMRCASRRDRDIADVVSAQRIPRLRAYATGLEYGTLTWDGLLAGIHNANPTQRGHQGAHQPGKCGDANCVQAVRFAYHAQRR